MFFIQLTAERREKAGRRCHFIFSLIHRFHHTVKTIILLKSSYSKFVKSRNTKFFLLEVYLLPQIERCSFTSVCHLYNTFPAKEQLDSSCQYSSTTTVSWANYFTCLQLIIILICFLCHTLVLSYPWATLLFVRVKLWFLLCSLLFLWLLSEVRG